MSRTDELVSEETVNKGNVCEKALEKLPSKESFDRLT